MCFDKLGQVWLLMLTVAMMDATSEPVLFDGLNNYRQGEDTSLAFNFYVYLLLLKMHLPF